LIATSPNNIETRQRTILLKGGGGLKPKNNNSPSLLVLAILLGRFLTPFHLAASVLAMHLASPPPYIIINHKMYALKGVGGVASWKEASVILQLALI